MRNSFKFLATAMVAVLLVCAVSVTAFAASTKFTDVDDHNETLSEAVALLSHLEVTKGTSETTFGTMESVTRQQMAAFVYRLFKPGKSIEGGANSTAFTDLTDSTYFGYVSWANGLGIIKGTSATTFNPKGEIVLQDAYTMLIRALGHETDEYQYPYDYIDKAEELGLGEDLDSVVGYTTKLRRGDIAVILYNTFFSDLAKEKITPVERQLSSGKYVIENRKEKVTLAEDIYKVVVGDFEIRATTRYAFNDDPDTAEYVPLIEEYEGETLQFVAVDENEELDEFVYEFEGTGLSGKADDYIMRGVTVYYTYEEKNGKKVIDDVYFVSSEHKSIETNSVTVSEVKANGTGDYFNGNTSYPRFENYLTVGSEIIYLYDAPYSYLKPDYGSIDAEDSDAAEDAKYALRNEKNLKLINIRCLDTDLGTYEYYIEGEDMSIDSSDESLINLQRIYAGGIYKMKFFDVDGDGIYEYAHYMPATYGFMDGDDDKTFSSEMTGNKPVHVDSKGSSVDLDFVPTIYYNEAVVTGTKFEDGDFVIAYLNPQANMIEVISVVKPYTGYLLGESVAKEHGRFKIDSTQFSTAYAYRAVEEFDDGAHYDNFNDSSRDYTRHKYGNGSTFPSLISAANDGEIFNVYAMKLFGYNTVLYYDHLESYSSKFEKDDLAIIVGDVDNKFNTYTKSQFDEKLGEDVPYAKVYYNGKVSYLPIAVDDMYPAPVLENGVYNLGAAVKSTNYGEFEYVDTICRVNVNSDGRYELVPLLYAEDKKGKYIGVNRDSLTLKEEDNNEQYGNELPDGITGYIKKISGKKYELVDIGGTSLLGDVTGSGYDVTYFDMTDSTRIVIKNVLTKKDNEIEYLEFDASTFKGTSETPLTNIQYVLKGNPDSAIRADLLLLYAEAENFEFATKPIKDGWRIVIDSKVSRDEEGNYRNFYKLFNPFTGAIEEKVPGEDYEEMAQDVDEAVANGSMIDVKTGEVAESADVVATFDTSKNDGLVYITEYDDEEGVMSFVPVVTIAEAFENKDLESARQLDGFIDSYLYNGIEKSFDGENFKTVDGSDEPRALNYKITGDTVIAVLKSDKPGADAVSKGEFTLADVSAITGGKDYKCYNDKVINKKETYSTKYAEYVKAYVYAADDAADEGEYPVAKFIIIVVNGDEKLVFSDYDDNFYDET